MKFVAILLLSSTAFAQMIFNPVTGKPENLGTHGYCSSFIMKHLVAGAILGFFGCSAPSVSVVPPTPANTLSNPTLLITGANFAANTITDQSSNHYSLPCTNGPTLVSSALNGKPGISFSAASSQYCTSTGNVNLAPSNTFSVYMVFKAASLPTFPTVFQANMGAVSPISLAFSTTDRARLGTSTTIGAQALIRSISRKSP